MFAEREAPSAVNLDYITDSSYVVRGSLRRRIHVRLGVPLVGAPAVRYQSPTVHLTHVPTTANRTNVQRAVFLCGLLMM